MTLMRTTLALVVALFVATPVTRAEVLRFGNEGNYPPFSMVDASGRLTGFEPELAREMCRRMNAECDIVPMDFKALIPSLLQGKLDGIVSQILPTPEREEKALFGIVLVQNNYSFVVKADSNYSFTNNGLKGVKVGLVRGSAPSKYIIENFEGVLPVWYDNQDQVRLELLNGRIDMTFGARINWRLELLDTPEGKDWKLADGAYWMGDPNLPDAKHGLSWIVRKDHDALLQRMDAALSAIIVDCTFTKLREKFISFSVLPAEARCVKPAG